jgi:hypothetical protein
VRARTACGWQSSFAAGLWLLLALGLGSCASVVDDGSKRAIDVVVLTTDREMAEAFLENLAAVEGIPTPLIGSSGWVRGKLDRESDGALYSVVVGPREGHDERTMALFPREAIRKWSPRYVLLIGTAPAVPYGNPLGAVGIVVLTCNFDLHRYETLGNVGKCYRPDGGLLTSALARGDAWVESVDGRVNRTGCPPARVKKVGALFAEDSRESGFIQAASDISESVHRAVVIESQGVFAARAIAESRREERKPIGMAMIRAVSSIRRPGNGPAPDGAVEDPETLRRQAICATRDVADFAVELIRRQWPVAPGSAH